MANYKPILFPSRCFSDGENKSFSECHIHSRIRKTGEAGLTKLVSSLKIKFNYMQGNSSVKMLAISTHDQTVVGSNLVSSNILDGNGVKAMPGSIPAPKSGSLFTKKGQLYDVICISIFH
jgi:hypothetical protein